MIHKSYYTKGDLTEFATEVLEVLDHMAQNRDIMSDADGLPVLTRFDARHSAMRLRVDMEIDASAIGMPINTPITALRTKEQPDNTVWLLGDDVVIATTPVEWPAEQVAREALEMNNLLDAHRKWFGRSAGGRER